MLGKRKRVQLEPQQRETLCRVLTEQFDLEIALKNRLAAAAHARLEWAKLLRGSILGSESNLPKGEFPPAAFRDAAFATYETIEEPCQVITLATEPLPLSLANNKRHGLPAVAASETPRTRKRVMLGLAQGSSAGPILFEDRSTSIPVTVKLVCTDCSRSDFPTMQGFVNHCRLAHSRVYGTHDECIQATGIIVDGCEREALLASGVEINTVHIPSLRSMFERAVGLATSNVSAQAATSMLSSSVEASSDVSTHLSQTLGFHKDTPTLAPFLGRDVKKKRIHVYDVPQPIDIMSCEDDGKLPQKRTSWYIKHRSAVDGWSINLATLAQERAGDFEPTQHALSESFENLASRFHVTRRVSVSDRSLYLPESKRPAASTSHTHRWQISVSSPSYSQHITTFLSRFTVTCVTLPPVFDTPILVSEPPFIACSTTDRPFLARLTFEWIGEQNRTFEVDHWVELDRSRATRPVLGDEQMFDVELDRNTVFLPVCDTANTIGWSGDGDYMKKAVTNSPVSTSQPRTINKSGMSEPEALRLLKGIVTRFPITMQDSGVRHQAKLPYALCPSRAKLLSLLPGRRKAIEWRRALAIRAEYDTLHASSTSKDNVRLTTGDVYRWLETEGHFPRHRVPTTKQLFQPESVSPTSQLGQPSILSQQFCPVCGVNIGCHIAGLAVQSQDKNAAERAGFRCPSELERRQAPIVHVYALLAASGMAYATSQIKSTNIASYTPRDLVMAAHPRLTLFVCREIKSLALSCSLVKHEAKPEKGLLIHNRRIQGKNRLEVDEALATHAFLAIVLEKLVKNLVGNALQVAGEMQSRTKTIRDGILENAPVSLLTPTHVLQGLLIKDSDPRGANEALSKCFARVGTLLAVGEAPRANT